MKNTIVFSTAPESAEFNGAFGLTAPFAENDHRAFSKKIRNASGFVGTRFQGANRIIALKTDIEAGCAGDQVLLRFSLQPGQYATTVCREYMKADPLRMV